MKDGGTLLAIRAMAISDLRRVMIPARRSMYSTAGVFAVTPFGGVTAGRVRIGTDTFDFPIKNGLK